MNYKLCEHCKHCKQSAIIGFGYYAVHMKCELSYTPEIGYHEQIRQDDGSQKETINWHKFFKMPENCPYLLEHTISESAS